MIHQMESETDGMHTFVVIIWVTGLNLNAFLTVIGAAEAEQADALGLNRERMLWLCTVKEVKKAQNT